MCTVLSVQSTRKAMMNLTMMQITLSMIALLTYMYDPEANTFQLILQGHTACKLAFSIYYSVSLYKINVTMTHVRQGTTPVHGNALREYDGHLSTLCNAWLTKYCYNYGDAQPDTRVVYLPANINKGTVYLAFCVMYRR